MSFFLTEDKGAYRKWVNVITSFLMPGLGQFLSGRRAAGVLWFLLNYGVRAFYVFLYRSPFKVSDTVIGLVDVIMLGLWLAAVIDSCRKPILRLHPGIWALICALVITIPALPVLVVQRTLFRSFLIPSSAMAPTLMGNRKSADGKSIKGDGVVADLWSYYLRSPKRGDIIVFKTEGIQESERENFHIPLHTLYVKRVAALPGERVSIRSSYVYINGQKLLEPKIFDLLSSSTNYPAGFSIHGPRGDQEVQLGSDEYFVLGDNPTNSLDSRYYGPIKRGFIIGKVGWIYRPSERRGFVE